VIRVEQFDWREAARAVLESQWAILVAVLIISAIGFLFGLAD
jgi:hypothetical protein